MKARIGGEENSHTENPHKCYMTTRILSRFYALQIIFLVELFLIQIQLIHINQLLLNFMLP